MSRPAPSSRRPEVADAPEADGGGVEDTTGEPRVNPLERLTRGGWRKGLLRLLIGALLVGVVLYFTSGDALALLARPATLAVVAGGAALHLLQRAARIAKWHRMLARSELVERSFGFLLRVQLIGMLANLLLPVSEALKVWVVSRNRRDAVAASESIVVETALHAAMVGATGCAGALLIGSATSWVWLAALGLTAGGAVLVLAARWWPRRQGRCYEWSAAALAWCALETAAQLAIYLLALRSVGVPLGVSQVLAFAPMLFLADLVMLTPSGIGLREALFATVLATQGDTASDTSVAVGLLVSSMLLLSTLMGGGTALLLPGRLDQPEP